MTMLCLALLSNVAIVAVLAVAVYALTRFWRNPQLAHALWVLVLLKLVTPPFVECAAAVARLVPGGEFSTVHSPVALRDLSAASLAAASFTFS